MLPKVPLSKKCLTALWYIEQKSASARSPDELVQRMCYDTKPYKAARHVAKWMES